MATAVVVTAMVLAAIASAAAAAVEAQLKEATADLRTRRGSVWQSRSKSWMTLRRAHVSCAQKNAFFVWIRRHVGT